MITEPLVFVLGAGSMKDYHFPIGWELVKEVVTQFQRSSQARQLLLEHSDFKESELDEFLRTLDGSAQNSVDAFLEEQKDFLNIGIAAMSIVLINCERPDELYQIRDPGANWLRNLLQHMRGTAFEEFKTRNNVSFITFNYDRAVEHFLCRAVQDTYGKTEAEAAAIVKEIPVIHVHGRLGYLPWQHRSGRPYEPKVDRQTLQTCIEHVKVVNRNTEINAEAFTQAKTLLRAANQIYFFGVGFNNENLNRLGVMDMARNKAKATGVGLTGTEHAEIQKRLGDKLEVRHNAECITLLRDFVDWG